MILGFFMLRLSGINGMTKNETRQTHLPYCLDRQRDGRYVVLNRCHKPVSFIMSKVQKSEGSLIDVVELRGLTEQTAAELDVFGRANLEHIYLYDDDCLPTASPENMQAYLARLSKLVALRIQE